MAEFYGIELRKSFMVYGQNKLVVVDKDAKAKIPRSVYFNTRSGDIYVGKNTIFGENVMVLTGKHLNIAEAQEQNVLLHYVPPQGRDIIIGEGCNIASGAIIIGNVRIGNYAVVAAGAVVTSDVPDRVLVGGVPAKVLKRL